MAKKKAAPSWEYLVVYIVGRDIADEAIDVHADADRFTEQLNKYAKSGWELVSFNWDSPRGAKAAFKRPVESG